MTLTPEEGRRVHVLTLLEGNRLGVGQAAEALGLTPRQVRRLRVRLRQAGPALGPPPPRGPRHPDSRPRPGALRRAQRCAPH
jgi:hypothetical protein